MVGAEDNAPSLNGLLWSPQGLLQIHTISFSKTTGLITTITNLEDASETRDIGTEHDLDVLAPGLLELQTNGMCGVHFTTLTADNHLEKLQLVARSMAESGVTAWYATIPTVPSDDWKKILPLLKPRNFSEVKGATLLGAHVEGPFLHPSKKGAHNDAFFKIPALHNYRDVYGEDNLRDVIRYITVAPELDGALDMMRDIRQYFPHIVVSIGHSSATFDHAVAGVQAGATSITHLFNAMTPLGHREPGIPGLMGVAPSRLQRVEDEGFRSQHSGQHKIETPYFTIIPDAVHLHPAVLRMAYHNNPEKCILITDSIELAGLPDGVYPPNGQITYAQKKLGNRATNVADVGNGEKETLIGSCITLSEGVRIMMKQAGLSLAQAVRAASLNIAELMKDDSRGDLKVGNRADIVVFDAEGNVKQTWIAGELVWPRDSREAT